METSSTKIGGVRAKTIIAALSLAVIAGRNEDYFFVETIAGIGFSSQITWLPSQGDISCY